ncbi:hypothetical protein EQW78_06940 [Oerskovia turbata]|uniref:Uncharacterized protein n=1 Tax=Oerskovia turbata TaxID=1713 RepID=A0A4Q1KX87_9CELL|nr:hypothetical protein [Oerskovia turbata]RXR24863.1 hypothetical protein EQW73_13640 [Oerskovia turbata]RXR34933.1 hypothetical protein EQW78_06940 [Oerskovia turbata]TGJ96989.1 hypothetical protein DLJ96_02830 [Actinotalea fermentans ATCC 43279 = JCM 9966 = DSM 3133]
MSAHPTAPPEKPAGPPATEVSTGPTVSGDTLRAVMIGATFLFVVLAVHQLVPSLLGSAAVALALAAVVGARPHTPVPHTVLFVGALAMLGADTSFDPVVFLLLPLAHLVLRASWWVARTPRKGRVERAVLVPELRRAAVIQVACQGLALVGFAASALDRNGFFVVVAAVALIGLVVLVVPRTWWR